MTDEELEALTYDEWDALLIEEWFEADPGAPVPASSREGELKYAHENRAAWKLVEESKLKGLSKEDAEELMRGVAARHAVRPETRADDVPCGVPVYDVSEGPSGSVLCLVCGNTRAAHRAGNGQRSARFNKNHDKLGKFSHGAGGKGGKVAAAHGAHLADAHAADLAGRVQEPDGGFTVDPRTGKDVKGGFAVAIYPERSKAVPVAGIGSNDMKSYVDNNKDLLDGDGNMFGGWHDPETGEVWLDVSHVTKNKDEAIALAKKHNQIAIFDLNTFESIPTGGTGRHFIWAKRGLMSTVERQVVVVGNNCPECEANRDPKRVPVHPHCNCEVVTVEVSTGMDRSLVDVVERFIHLNGPTFEQVELNPQSVAVLPLDDVRFGDVASWYERVAPLLETAQFVAFVVDDEPDLADALESAAGGIEALGQIAKRRLWLALAGLAIGEVDPRPPLPF